MRLLINPYATRFFLQNLTFSGILKHNFVFKLTKIVGQVGLVSLIGRIGQYVGSGWLGLICRIGLVGSGWLGRTIISFRSNDHKFTSINIARFRQLGEL